MLFLLTTKTQTEWPGERRRSRYMKLNTNYRVGSAREPTRETPILHTAHTISPRTLPLSTQDGVPWEENSAVYILGTGEMLWEFVLQRKSNFKIDIAVCRRDLPWSAQLCEKNTMRTFHVGSVKVTKFERAYPVAAYPGDDFLLSGISLGCVCKSGRAYPGDAPTG